MTDHAKENALGWWNTIVEMVGALDATIEARYDAATDATRDRIWESVLSVMVRDGWRNPSDTMVDANPEEYEILLTTGGPALRIYGHLAHGAPDSDPVLQWQDWGTPWTDWWPPNSADIPYKDTLRIFANQFYFGDG